MNINEDEKNVFLQLYDLAKQEGADYAAGVLHIENEDTEAHGDTVIAEYGVYINQRPASDVLDDLTLWAEDNGDGSLFGKIEELKRKPMKWEAEQ